MTTKAKYPKPAWRVCCAGLPDWEFAARNRADAEAAAAVFSRWSLQHVGAGKAEACTLIEIKSGTGIMVSLNWPRRTGVDGGQAPPSGRHP